RNARIGCPAGYRRRRRAKNIAEVSIPFSRCRQCGLRNTAEMKLVLFPCKQEKGVISSVVELGNPDRTREHSAVVVLAVLGLAEGALDRRHARAVLSLVSIVEPVVRVEDAVLDDGVCNPMKVVRSRLRREAFDT